MMSDDVVFALQDASAGYDGRIVLSNIDLTVRTGECVAIMGRSGAGKSTLLSLLYDSCPDNVALIPQAAALVKPLSVFHNVYMGRLDRHSTIYNLRNLIWPDAIQVDAVRAVLESLDLSEKLFESAGGLSGGQQQRASVARALFNGRPIILGDEPVSALDRVQGAGVLRRLRNQASTLVLVMHDTGLALEFADRVVVLSGGRKVLDEDSHHIDANDLTAHFGEAL